MPTDPNAPPFVPTTIARHLLSRLKVTLEERAITVISGPWGIGKTTAIDAFTAENAGQCIIVKVDPGSSKRGASAVAVMQHTLEALRPMLGFEREDGRWSGAKRLALSNSYWSLRTMIFNYLSKWDPYKDYMVDRNEPDLVPPFMIIFDEAQYLSREAIEMLRFWNDTDRSTTPFPVGLAFIGNNEFSLGETDYGESVISGAVRSRALFIEALDYQYVTDADLVMLSQSRGVTDAAAIAAIVAHFSAPRIQRDLRNVVRLLTAFRRRAGDAPVTLATVLSILSPA